MRALPLSLKANTVFRYSLTVQLCVNMDPLAGEKTNSGSANSKSVVHSDVLQT